MTRLQGVYQGSKYLKYQVLVSKEELVRLFQSLGSFHFYRLGGLFDGNPLCSEDFLKEYGSWIEHLQKGASLEEQKVKQTSASALSYEEDAFYKERIKDRYLVKLQKAAVHMQAHFFHYSKDDQTFRSMTFGSNTIFWGLQFSFPQLYQDPQSMEIFSTRGTVNGELFQKIKHWVRQETRATPFEIEGKKTYATFRLGKECFSWIHSHPGLQELRVYGE